MDLRWRTEKSEPKGRIEVIESSTNQLGSEPVMWLKTLSASEVPLLEEGEKMRGWPWNLRMFSWELLVESSSNESMLNCRSVFELLKEGVCVIGLGWGRWVASRLGEGVGED